MIILHNVNVQINEIFHLCEMSFFDILKALWVEKKKRMNERKWWNKNKKIQAGIVKGHGKLTLQVKVILRSNSCLMGLCFSTKSR